MLRYVEKGSVVADLIGAGVLYCGPDQKLLTDWVLEGPAPDLFKMLTPKEKKRDQAERSRLIRLYLRATWHGHLSCGALRRTFSTPKPFKHWKKSSRCSRIMNVLTTGLLTFVCTSGDLKRHTPPSEGRGGRIRRHAAAISNSYICIAAILRARKQRGSPGFEKGLEPGTPFGFTPFRR